jgi:hypothetical protein
LFFCLFDPLLAGLQTFCFLFSHSFCYLTEFTVDSSYF